MERKEDAEVAVNKEQKALREKRELLVLQASMAMTARRVWQGSKVKLVKPEFQVTEEKSESPEFPADSEERATREGRDRKDPEDPREKSETTRDPATTEMSGTKVSADDQDLAVSRVPRDLRAARVWLGKPACLAALDWPAEPENEEREAKPEPRAHQEKAECREKWDCKGSKDRVVQKDRPELRAPGAPMVLQEPLVFRAQSAQGGLRDRRETLE